jgi:hypothetical protein
MRLSAYSKRTLVGRSFLSLLLVLSACLVASVARAQVHVELITVEPGEALWERFGHTALRVYHAELDTVYSFGSAPFFDPHFVLQFARGEGEFMVVAEPYAATLARYKEADRTLIRQPLLLSDERALELYLLLTIVAQPPRNRYLYDQLYDNCATRVRDLINRVSDGALSRAASRHRPHHSYREDTLAAMAGHPIGHWALDLLGGRHQDLPVSSFHEMYLPVHLRDRVAEARIVEGGLSRPLSGPAQVVFLRHGPPLSRATWAARLVMLLLAAALLALGLGVMDAAGLAKRRCAALALSLSALWSGLFGVLVLPLTLFSHVHNFSPNENAWLFWPSDLLLAPALYSGVVKQRAHGAPFSAYVALKLLSLVVLLVAKAAGLATQHNLAFVCLAAIFLAPWLVRIRRGQRLAPALASR